MFLFVSDGLYNLQDDFFAVSQYNHVEEIGDRLQITGDGSAADNNGVFLFSIGRLKRDAAK